MAESEAVMEQSRGRIHLEDLTVGQRFTTATFEITAANLHEFASSFDPQPIHLDAEVAADEFFGGVVASGWQVLCISMKLMVESRFLGATPLIGVEVDGIRFRKPVVAGDVLHVEAEVTELLPSAKPGRGYVHLDLTTFRQGADAICSQRWKLLVPRRTEDA